MAYEFDNVGSEEDISDFWTIMSPHGIVMVTSRIELMFCTFNLYHDRSPNIREEPRW